MIALWYKDRPPILQMKIDDHLYGTTVEGYDMGTPKAYRAARKKFAAWLPVRHYARKAVAPAPQPPHPTLLDTLLGFRDPPPLPRPNHLKRFRSAPQATFGDFAAGAGIPPHEWDMLHSFPAFTGFFEHMFELNDLSFFDEVQGRLEARGVSFKDFFVHDVVAFEFLRRHLGVADYAGMERVARWVQHNPIGSVLHDRHFFPSAANLSYVLRRVPAENFMAFFHQLAREGLALGVIKDGILIWDGTFIRSNCNNNRNPLTGAYNDPEAGFARHVGKRLGVGYQPGLLYGYNKYTRRLPVHFTMFPGNRNDNPAFRGTLGEFLPLKLGTWKLAIVDTGAFSLKTLKYCSKRGMWPLVRAKNNLAELPARELKPGYWFCTEWLPQGWSDDDVLEAYAWRPSIETGIAEYKSYYDGGRLPTRGMEGATQHFALNAILDWLRALTAQKLGRPDLACKWSAFGDPREGFNSAKWCELARMSGYPAISLPPPPGTLAGSVCDNGPKRDSFREGRSKNS